MGSLSLTPAEAEALRRKAGEHGLTLDQWLEQLVGNQTSTSNEDVVDRILALQRSVLPDPDGETVQDYIRNDRQQR